MPISFNCTCGKAFRAPDEAAGRRTTCPACHAAVTVPARAADGADDFEVLPDEPDPVPAPQPPPRIKAESVPTPDPAPAPKKKKKKRKARPEEEETGEERLARIRAAEARAVQVFRSIAFIVLGAVIVIGVAICFTVYGKEVKAEGARVVGGLIVFGVMGVAAIVKGLIGLFFGQLLGEE